MSTVQIYRNGLEEYAKTKMHAIQQMNAEDHNKSIKELQVNAIKSGLPFDQIKVLFTSPITLEELELRATFHHLFDKLNLVDLQSHFKYFYTKKLIQETKESSQQKNCDKRAINLLVDEIGKSILRKGAKPKVPTLPIEGKKG